MNNIIVNIDDDNILYISQFGSYETNEWIKNVSDIDIGIIIKSFDSLDYSLEDRLTKEFEILYNYNNINITIVELNLDDKLTRNIICGKTLYSILNEKDLKYKCLYIEKTVSSQRNYYEYKKLEKLKSEVSELW